MIIGLAVWLTNYYAAISTLASILGLLLVFRVYGLQINSAYKISWIILILMFPIMGACLYLMFGRTGALGSMRKWFDKVHAAYVHLLPQDDITSYTEEEVKAISYGLNSGVNFIATIHSSSPFELKNKVIFKALQELNGFSSVVMLKNIGTPCTVDSIISMKEIGK